MDRSGLIENAISLLQKGMSNSEISLSEKVAFLERKGLTNDEIYNALRGVYSSTLGRGQGVMRWLMDVALPGIVVLGAGAAAFAFTSDSDVFDGSLPPLNDPQHQQQDGRGEFGSRVGQGIGMENDMGSYRHGSSANSALGYASNSSRMDLQQSRTSNPNPNSHHLTTSSTISQLHPMPMLPPGELSSTNHSSNSSYHHHPKMTSNAMAIDSENNADKIELSALKLAVAAVVTRLSSSGCTRSIDEGGLCIDSSVEGDVDWAKELTSLTNGLIHDFKALKAETISSTTSTTATTKDITEFPNIPIESVVSQDTRTLDERIQEVRRALHTIGINAQVMEGDRTSITDTGTSTGNDESIEKEETCDGTVKEGSTLTTSPALATSLGALAMYISMLKENPAVPRYRRLSNTNKSFVSNVIGLKGHEEFLVSVGFEPRVGVGYDWMWFGESPSSSSSSSSSTTSTSTSTLSYTKDSGRSKTAPPSIEVSTILEEALRILRLAKGNDWAWVNADAEDSSPLLKTGTPLPSFDDICNIVDDSSASGIAVKESRMEKEPSDI